MELKLILKAPTREDLEQVRAWRNKPFEDGTGRTLRTPYMNTSEMQARFYDKVICNRQSNSRYWSVYCQDKFIGFPGLTGIEWENGLAEISLVVNPDEQQKGFGAEIVRMVLEEAFGNMGLKTIYGECYECNPAVEFWKKTTDERGGYYTMIPRRKRWQGQLYDALHFSIWR